MPWCNSYHHQHFKTAGLSTFVAAASTAFAADVTDASYDLPVIRIQCLASFSSSACTQVTFFSLSLPIPLRLQCSLPIFLSHLSLNLINHFVSMPCTVCSEQKAPNRSFAITTYLELALNLVHFHVTCRLIITVSSIC